MDVFKAFPSAIVANDWQLGQLTESTEVGKLWKSLGYKAVIVDEAGTGELNNTPTADGLRSDTLLYVKPADLPTLSVAELIASYYWYQSSADQYYRIVDAGIGKNQETGKIEHVEFMLRPAEFAGELDES